MTTWTPVAKQSETWSAHNPKTHVFDPYVFDRNPVFDTGSVAGVWLEKTKQSEVWVLV